MYAFSKNNLLKKLESIFFWLGTAGIIVLIALLVGGLISQPTQSPRLNDDKEIKQYQHDFYYFWFNF